MVSSCTPGAIEHKNLECCSTPASVSPSLPPQLAVQGGDRGAHTQIPPIFVKFKTDFVWEHGFHCLFCLLSFSALKAKLQQPLQLHNWTGWEGMAEDRRKSVPIFLHPQLLGASLLIFWLMDKLINSSVRKQADGCPAVLCPVMPIDRDQGRREWDLLWKEGQRSKFLGRRNRTRAGENGWGSFRRKDLAASLESPRQWEEPQGVTNARTTLED